MLGQKRKRAADIPSTSSRVSTEYSMDNNTPSQHHPRSVSEDREIKFRRQGVEDPNNESVFIVGPVVAEDAQVIENSMPPEPFSQTPKPKSHPYNVYSNDPRKPILYTTVSRRRQGVRGGTPPGENQKEILEQVLGPFRDDLVKLWVVL